MPQPPIPAPILVADLVILTTRQTIRSRTYWASDAAPANESQLTAAADAIKAAFQTALIALLPDLHMFQRVEARWYGNSDAFFFANSTSGAEPGDIVAVEEDGDGGGGSTDEDVMPDDTCLIIQKKTGLRGPANQGRIFFGGIAEAVQWGGAVSDQYVTQAKTLAAKLNTDINVSGSGLTTILHGRHWNRKTNTMVPISKVYVVKAIGSRMDRRPKTLMERL